MATIRRAVFDTNVLISAYLWTGTPRTALDIVRSGRCTLVSARSAIEEFVRVLGYRKFDLSPEENRATPSTSSRVIRRTICSLKSPYRENVRR